MRSPNHRERVTLPASSVAIVVLASISLLGGCSEDEGDLPGRAGRRDVHLRITVRETPSAESRTFTVRCRHDQSDGNCSVARTLNAADFAPTPADQPCTQEYGGPETGNITGTVRGTDVAARVSRSNGCQIARWKKLVAPFIAVHSP